MLFFVEGTDTILFEKFKKPCLLLANQLLSLFA